ncbi:MAG: ROK family transcriptional regulator [Rhizobiaceae bacterium]|nr:ROK family transcriptional regulator [Rhizobiaceae bacterium]MCV0405575.1 ROK family transcriptional regulator [Rhizobiaceae bacterium]
MRDHNQRLVLSLVRQHGALAKSDIARATGLSAQTVSVIMRQLEGEGLLLRGEPVRGKVGQPSIPMSLNPEGAWFLGLKLGRRSADLVLIDLVGTVRSMRSLSYLYPSPSAVLDFVSEGIGAMRADLGAAHSARIGGLGVAMPFELWNWADAVGAPRDALDEWRIVDIRAEIAARVPFPVYLQNDATAACGAELVFGLGGEFRDFVYIYVGAFVGGGIVLNGRVFSGRTGNAGALGSMPVPGADGRVIQLIDVASIAVLERRLKARGLDAGFLWTSPSDWSVDPDELSRWIGQAARAIAHAIVSASAVIDFEAAIIDGWLPPAVRGRLVEAIVEALDTLDTEGLAPPVVRAGAVGIHARALGGASLPLSERFLVGSAGSAMPAEGAALPEPGSKIVMAR